MRRARSAAARGPLPAAVVDAERHFTHMLAGRAAALLLRERAIDIHDVCIEGVLRMLHGAEVTSRRAVVAARDDSVCVAARPDAERSSSPSLARTSRVSSSAEAARPRTPSILARSFGVPALTGVEALGRGPLDGRRGDRRRRPRRARRDARPEPAARYYERSSARLDGAARSASSSSVTSPRSPRTGGGSRSARTSPRPRRRRSRSTTGAEAIGLFRTEMLFLDRDEPPTEEEQFEVYRRARRGRRGRPPVTSGRSTSAATSRSP